ncbi:MAG: hypothetical protein HY211_07000 [Candidatus Omnitrophica bacterium]|nr:hypothetical protein [Candidatus Omnitrophota bacterium]
MSSSRKRGSDSRWSLPSASTEGGNDTTILFTGIGPSNAAKALRRSLAGGRYRLIVSAGFSGGTRPGLKVGDLVLASEVVDISLGRRWVPAYEEPFMLSLSKHEREKTVRSPFDELRANGNTNVILGPIATVSRPVSDPTEKERLGQRHGVVAVDMETAAVAAAAGAAGVPWIALRAILDPMEVRLSVGSLRQGLRCVADPFRWRNLRQFMGAVRSARESLSKGLKVLLSQPFVLRLRRSP